MVDFMAEGSGKQLCTFHFKGLHVSVVSPYLHIVGPGYRTAFPRQAKTAFPAGLLSACFQNAGIDEYNRILSRNIDYNDSFENAYLRRRKTHTVGIIHRFQHIVNQLLRPGRHLLHFLADLFKNRISHNSYIPDSHFSFPPFFFCYN